MNRFIKLYKDDEKLAFREHANILVDTETGVNYLVYTFGTTEGGGSGIAVLIDKDGKPIITEGINDTI